MKTKKAFTLLETVIVIVILGILAAIIILESASQETKPIKVVKVVTAKQETYYDLNTLEPTTNRSNEQTERSKS